MNANHDQFQGLRGGGRPSSQVPSGLPNRRDKEDQPTSILPSVDSSSQPAIRVPKKKYSRTLIAGSIVGIMVVLGGIAFLAVRLILAPADITAWHIGVQSTNQYIGGGAIVFPLHQLDISYPVTERVVNVLVKAGDTVTANQQLIQLDPTQISAQIQQASDDLGAAQAYLNSVSATGNPVTIAQAQQNYNLAKNKYNALIAETSSPTLKKGFLISPMSGVITAVNINPGEVFAPDVSLVTIMDESSVIVHANIPLTNLTQVHIGQSATITPSALPNLNFTGTVLTIIPQADPQTDTFQVWVQVANPDRTLLPGMSAFVRIQSTAQAIAVPRLAVLDPDGQTEVFLIQGQHVHLHKVHVAGRFDDTLFIDSGLSAGDDIVLVGIYTLQDGQKVSVSHVEG